VAFSEGRESSPVAVDTLILDNSEEFQSALALSKSGIDRTSTTKIVKLNTEINFFIKKLPIYLKTSAG
jgi:hypothetical protein